MRGASRRQFLAEVGRGMLVAAVGPALASDLGLGSVFAEEAPKALTFGGLEPLVGLMEETPPDRLLRLLVDRLHQGTPLRELLAGAALANARAFGGEDYVGFHTMMALVPAYQMAQELSGARQALPVLKVIHRNSRRLQETGGRKAEVLHPVPATAVPAGGADGARLREAVRHRDLRQAEGLLASLVRGSAEDAFNELLVAVEDATEVHRVVMPYRAWGMLDLIGREHAHTMLRQSVHYCVKNEVPPYVQMFGGSRSVLPRLLDEHHLAGGAPGHRPADDGWVEHLSRTIFRSTAEQAAEAAAMALAEGMAPDAVGEAVSVAANQLLLRDAGRPAGQTSPGKPVGSVHGDSIGVHACDSANAWRNMARVSNPRNTAACLILAAYQVAQDRVGRGGDFLNWQPYPHPEHLEQVRGVGADGLLDAAEDAIRHQDQARACALVYRYGSEGRSARPVFDLLLRYAVSEDGALHAEKYYRTVSEEFAATRPAFRWRQLAALARVTASEYGRPAPGYADACRLLKI